jgi:uncharacterized protein
LVTGASTGLGQEFARQLAEASYNVVVVARSGEALSRVASDLSESFGVDTEVLQADLLKTSDRLRVLKRLASGDRPIDILVNNAGWGLPGGLHDTSWSDEKDHLDIHVTIPLELTHRVLPMMRERGRGRVIVVSSVAAFLSRGTYSSAKRFWVTMAKSLTARYRADNVTVTAVCPGFTRTEFHERMGMNIAGVPRFAWLSAERVASVGLRHAFRGQAVSIPTLRYRLLAAIAPSIPARFHRLGSED